MKLNKLLTVVVTVVALMGLTIPAQADHPPTATGTFNLQANTAKVDGYCSFPVRIDYVNHQRTTRTTLADGTTVDRSTGNADVTATNLTNQESVHYKINGPSTVTTYTSGAFTIDATGPNLLWTTVANSYPGVPQLAYTNGHVQVAVAAGPHGPKGPTGLTTSYKLSGRSVDVCAVLS